MFEMFDAEDFSRGFDSIRQVNGIDPNIDQNLMALIVKDVTEVNPGVRGAHVAWLLSVGIQAEKNRRERLGL